MHSRFSVRHRQAKNNQRGLFVCPFLSKKYNEINRGEDERCVCWFNLRYNFIIYREMKKCGQKYAVTPFNMHGDG